MADKQITVNVVAPGGIKTDMYHAVCREYIPNGENLTNEEVDEVHLSAPLTPSVLIMLYPDLS